jgi:hypothetical protein
MKNLLNEIKAMNKIAGTQMTKEQEVALIRERLEQLNELEFGTQKAFDSYQKQHDMRGDTIVTVSGKRMSVKTALKQSGDNTLKGTPIFGKKTDSPVFAGRSDKDKLKKMRYRAIEDAEVDMGWTDKNGFNKKSQEKNLNAARANVHRDPKIQKKYNDFIINKIKKYAADNGITDKNAIQSELDWLSWKDYKSNRKAADLRRKNNM